MDGTDVVIPCKAVSDLNFVPANVKIRFLPLSNN